jgi:hypothetical protein
VLQTVIKKLRRHVDDNTLETTSFNVYYHCLR